MDCVGLFNIQAVAENFDLARGILGMLTSGKSSLQNYNHCLFRGCTDENRVHEDQLSLLGEDISIQRSWNVLLWQFVPSITHF